MMIYGWSAQIGDPTALGWLTVLGYVLAALLCLRAARMGGVGDANLWTALAAALFLLGVNKQLDLQSLLTAIGRHLAQSEGWYDNRRGVQELFVLALVLAGIAGAGVVARRLRGREGAVQLAGVGMALLTAFIIIRAVSFHHVDALLRTDVSGLRIAHLLELGGIAVIALAASRRPVRPAAR